MTVAYDTSYRGWPTSSQSAVCLEDKFEIVKDIGDGSFGSVALGRTRGAGAHIVRRNTLVAIKTMKKTFETFSQCMELREVIFLKSLPNHPHLVPAYDIFLDPLSRKLHIVMEYMDGNLYQLMKARDHKFLDVSNVKSILFQILSGLEHIHEHNFFHRDIKPENILVSTSAPDNGTSFKRYSTMVTPPSTPPSYSIKIADFGLARETYSRVPYTTYVSTRWYRAPEVLLRAGEYSAPVDIWAIGAMAVEIATLKPLFPGGNEVDQVWRVCEIMGSPGSWVNKHDQKVGGGEWKDGIKLAQKLGFSFPKMAPHSLETVLPAPTWPASLAHFVTWCLMWDPKTRPTSRQALEHEFFVDALDPLRPKSSSTSRILGRKASTIGAVAENGDGAQALTSKSSSWFRKSLGPKEIAPPAVPEHVQAVQNPSPRPAPVHANTSIVATTIANKARPGATKRATWTNGANANAAPIPILPSIRPVSPLPDTATAQADTRGSERPEERQNKKLGRQLSVNSQGNHYAEAHRQEAERALNGDAGLKSPTSSQRESFFSHLRKRARRLSGRNQGAATPTAEDIEANAGCTPWPSSNRQSVYDQQAIAPRAPDPSADPGFAELDRALQSVRYSLDTAAHASQTPPKYPTRMSSNPALKRHHSLPDGEGRQSPVPAVNGLMASRTRRSVRYLNPAHRYETPDEEDELLDEAITSAHKAATRLDVHGGNINATTYQPTRPIIPHVTSEPYFSSAPYLTPSPSKDQNGVSFGAHEYTPTKPVDIPPIRVQKHGNINPGWPTPPYDENDWAAAAAASIFATQAAYR
ncbi:Serine/threonine protein kinase [Friedmanniomyces endolithicus]|nr:Serine/threonine protein kinase [Friedmanniomyces endolithicus]KAK0831826.1 Serine/threonine protein kinase [Friedmanniomyces endolithicus]KAK0844047.1 Serine/threonine protein kinase [Friedmanniomyces endolithicus]KAK0863957.1 Serine/threonine protein kinase [Friedmanniomyces endolithicus]KAK0890658.1 Serine/threonine protein kinase [Friedmanniomyces endolithicus]